MATGTATNTILPVVLAGGAGTRLWPLSRELEPKQFHRLLGEETLLQQTLGRLARLGGRPPVVVCNDEHRAIVADQCRDCGIEPDAMVLEPVSRNTAPAVALAALNAGARGDDPVLLVTPADHHIGDEPAFAAAVGRAVPFARDGGIVVFGIPPTHPATGYGYIKTGPGLAGDGRGATVAAFSEKPTRTRAEHYLAEGGWYWNSGMFLVRTSVYLDELKAHRPDIHQACVRAGTNRRAGTQWHLAGNTFEQCPGESIDRAIMEKTRKGVVVPADMGWSDIGDWTSLAEVLAKDDHGNTGDGDVVAIDSSDCHLSAQGRLVAVIGIDGLVVVETPDAVLVMPKNRSQDTAALVAQLRQMGRSEYREHKAPRPGESVDGLEG
ncbi:MAG: mannose-1-phosphate guanylyltransferase/mannose-6-phosphate isomerase [Gammaproteobacteria bacterium]|nr:mannose-1-phosphate guanylyltransferase/mannose-6-phosphate isomerase [Gammaproteobacteria bacterium]